MSTKNYYRQIIIVLLLIFLGGNQLYAFIPATTYFNSGIAFLPKKATPKTSATPVLLKSKQTTTNSSENIAKYKKKSTKFVAMDTYFAITVYTTTTLDKKVFAKCIKRVQEIEKWGNSFDPQSQLSQINKSAHQDNVPINADLFKILKYAQQMGQDTNGAFDITVQPLIDFYKQSKNQKTIPKVPQSLLKEVNYQNIILDPKIKTVRLKNQAQITLGGILKGYAIDEIVTILKEHKIQKALINGGGNIYVLGTNEENKPWLIGIKNPHQTTPVIRTVELVDQGISTSAGYERYTHQDGKKYSHILNPKTGMPVLAYGSVTVIAPTAIQADVLSTAIYVDNTLQNNFPDLQTYIYRK